MRGFPGRAGSTGYRVAVFVDSWCLEMAQQRGESFEFVLKLVLLQMNCVVIFSKPIHEGMIIKALH